MSKLGAYAIECLGVILVCLVQSAVSFADVKIPVGNVGNSRGVAVDQSLNIVYVPNFFDNTISALQRDGNFVTTIPVGRGPTDVAVNQNNHLVYVTNSLDDTLTVILGDGNIHVATVAVSKGPNAVAVDSKLNFIYVANADNDSVTLLGVGANPFSEPPRVIAEIPVGIAPRAIALNPITGFVYVANFGRIGAMGNTVSVIDGRPMIPTFKSAWPTPL